MTSDVDVMEGSRRAGSKTYPVGEDEDMFGFYYGNVNKKGMRLRYN